MPLFSRKPQGIEVDVHEARNLHASGATLVDVRESSEWAGGRAAGARHVPLGQLAGSVNRIPRDSPVLVICARGNRSLTAAKFLQEHGFDAKSVRGGTLAWAREGLPVER